MEKGFTPEQSFELINNVLDRRRVTYEEKGTNILIWGIGIMIAGIAQFILLQTQWRNLHGLTWFFTMIPLFIYSAYIGHLDRKKFIAKGGNKDVWDGSGITWLFVGVLGMLNGFVFRDLVHGAFTTFIFLPFCVAAMTTAISLKKKSFVYLVLLAVIVCYLALYIPMEYHSLVAAGIALLLFVIPGIILLQDNKQRQNV